MTFWRDDIDPEHEPHKVLIKRDELVDPARNGRVVPIKVYYPVAHNLSHLPVIIWSHGLGGSREGAAFLNRYIASHGYVVVNVQHYGTDSSLWEGKSGHPWDVIRATKITHDTVINRFGDIPFVLDSLEDWASEHPDIAEHMDLSTLGMSGHSFGAMTTQVMLGQSYPDADRKLIQLKDDRFKAGIAYSPVPLFAYPELEASDIYGSIDRPLLHFSGTKDESPVEGFGYEDRLQVFKHAGNEDQMLVILKDGDHMVYAGSRGKLADNPKRKTHEAILKVVSLAYWGAHLNGNEKASSWLESGLKDYLAGEAELRL